MFPDSLAASWGNASDPALSPGWSHFFFRPLKKTLYQTQRKTAYEACHNCEAFLPECLNVTEVSNKRMIFRHVSSHKQRRLLTNEKMKISQFAIL